MADLLDRLLRICHLRQCRFHARAGLQVHVPLRALPERDVRQGHADRDLRHATRRAARCPLAQGRPRRAEPGRLHRLQPVRAGLPDRHRHPQGPAVRVHRLRRLCRRLRHGDGQDGLRPGSGQVHHRERHEEAVDPGTDSAPCAAAPHPDLHLDPAGDRDRHGRQHGPAHTVQGQRGARSWRPGAYRRARADRERLPAADHECHRGDAKVPDHRRGSAGSGDRVRERRDRRFHTGRAACGAGAGTL